MVVTVHLVEDEDRRLSDILSDPFSLHAPRLLCGLRGQELLSAELAHRSLRTRREPEGNRKNLLDAHGIITERYRKMIRKLKSGEYRLYSRKKNPKTGKRRNLGTFKTRQAVEAHERAVQFFKRR